MLRHTPVHLLRLGLGLGLRDLVARGAVASVVEGLVALRLVANVGGLNSHLERVTDTKWLAVVQESLVDGEIAVEDCKCRVSMG